MNQKQKRIYAAPTAEVVDVRMNGMLCGSNLTILLWDQPNANSNFGDTWTWDE